MKFRTASKAVAGAVADQWSISPALLSEAAVARELSISGRGVRRLVASGVLPSPIKVGGLSRWLAQDIAVFISDCAQVNRPTKRRGVKS